MSYRYFVVRVATGSELEAPADRGIVCEDDSFTKFESFQHGFRLLRQNGDKGPRIDFWKIQRSKKNPPGNPLHLSKPTKN
jgi:hypothetical protein